MKLNLGNSINEIKLAVIDAANKSAAKRLTVYQNDIKCKSQCAGCCSRLISISIAEAIIIIDYLEAHNSWGKVKTESEKLMQTAVVADPVSWFKMNTKCPILNQETKLCLAYPVRPTPCSTHFVMSNPAVCDPWAINSGEYSPIDMVEFHEEFMKKMEKHIDGHGILGYRMSLPIALIFADKVRMRSDVSFNDLLSLIYNELTP
jgi:Fe-S-cluster containining protein